MRPYTFTRPRKAAIDHPLRIERHVALAHRFQAGIGHHLGVDPVALGARLVGDPGEHDGFAGLQLHALRKRGQLARLDVVGDPLAIIQRAMFAPDLAGHLRELGIGLEFLLRHGDDETIDVRHAYDFLL
ncbi:hypothetical protein ACVINW_001976 [Bradyrhizobium sp. USDA 4461]